MNKSTHKHVKNKIHHIHLLSHIQNGIENHTNHLRHGEEKNHHIDRIQYWD